MDSQTFFTILLSSTIASGIALVFYAMSIVAISPRLARIGIWIAWASMLVLCIWYGGTNEMRPALRYSIAAAVMSICTVAACAALDHIRTTVIANETQYAVPSPELAHKAKIRMARRWIKLSDDILSDLSMTKVQFNTPPVGNDISPELRSRLWQQESQRALQAFQDGLNRMSQKYLSRVAEAKIEMQAAGISLSDSGPLLNGPMVNSFSWEAWASKLGAEGRHILTDMNEQE